MYPQITWKNFLLWDGINNWILLIHSNVFYLISMKQNLSPKLRPFSHPLSHWIMIRFTYNLKCWNPSDTLFLAIHPYGESKSTWWMVPNRSYVISGLCVIESTFWKNNVLYNPSQNDLSIYLLWLQSSCTNINVLQIMLVPAHMKFCFWKSPALASWNGPPGVNTHI